MGALLPKELSTMMNEQNNGGLNFNPWGGPAEKLGPYQSLLTQGSQLSGPDPRGIQAIREQALRQPGTSSPWAQMMMQKQGMEQAKEAGSIAQRNAQQTAGAYGDLASHGGLRSGAAERIAAGGAQNAAMGGQQNALAGQSARLGIGVQDDQQRLDFLKNLPTLENQNAAQSQFNASSIINDNQQKNQYNLERYKSDMGAWAAKQSADAMRNSGKK